MGRIVIVKTGSAIAEAIAVAGDFDRLIAAGLGIALEELAVVEVFKDQSLPDPASVSGAVVTGSSAMVSKPEPWAERTAAWLTRAARSHIAVLGICYGHQILAWALGGQVAQNPKGREIGTVEVVLSKHAARDPLFAGLPSPLVVHATHQESVLRLPPGARLLGGNAHDQHQIFSIGEAAWGVQFHPEFSAEVVRAYLQARRETIAAEGLETERLLAECRESGHGTVILRRFAELALGGARD